MSKGTPKIQRWDKELLQYILIFILGGTFQELILEGALFSSDPINWGNIPINGSFWLLLWKGSEYLVIFLDYMGIHWDQHPGKRFVYAFVLTILYVFVAVLFIYHIFFVIFGKFTVSELWSKLDFWDFFPTILITLGIGGFMHGRAFLFQWREAAVEVEKLKNENLKTQYESLKNQVNPHFLFNSLNVLSELVYDDQARAVDFIRKMSQVYRYVLDKKDLELVPLADELKFLQSYAYLQQIRFGDNLSVNLKMDPEEGMVPPLSIQILLENAIKHNIISNDKPLTVQIAIGNQKVVVSNNIQEKLSKDSTGIGLNNLKSRYKYLSDRPIVVSKNDTEFKVELPILKLKE